VTTTEKDAYLLCITADIDYSMNTDISERTRVLCRHLPCHLLLGKHFLLGEHYANFFLSDLRFEFLPGCGVLLLVINKPLGVHLTFGGGGTSGLAESRQP